jgi:hypothetical protein
MKTGYSTKISQTSESQNHLPKKSNFHISISPSANKKKQFAMTDPVKTFLFLSWISPDLTIQ